MAAPPTVAIAPVAERTKKIVKTTTTKMTKVVMTGVIKNTRAVPSLDLILCQRSGTVPKSVRVWMRNQRSTTLGKKHQAKLSLVLSLNKGFKECATPRL